MNLFADLYSGPACLDPQGKEELESEVIVLAKNPTIVLPVLWSFDAVKITVTPVHPRTLRVDKSRLYCIYNVTDKSFSIKNLTEYVPCFYNRLYWILSNFGVDSSTLSPPPLPQSRLPGAWLYFLFLFDHTPGHVATGFLSLYTSLFEGQSSCRHCVFPAHKSTCDLCTLIQVLV